MKRGASPSQCRSRKPSPNVAARSQVLGPGEATLVSVVSTVVAAWERVSQALRLRGIPDKGFGNSANINGFSTISSQAGENWWYATNRTRKRETPGVYARTTSPSFMRRGDLMQASAWVPSPDRDGRHQTDSAVARSSVCLVDRIMLEAWKEKQGGVVCNVGQRSWWMMADAGRRAPLQAVHLFAPVEVWEVDCLSWLAAVDLGRVCLCDVRVAAIICA